MVNRIDESSMITLHLRMYFQQLVKIGLRLQILPFQSTENYFVNFSSFQL